MLRNVVRAPSAKNRSGLAPGEKAVAFRLQWPKPGDMLRNGSIYN